MRADSQFAAGGWLTAKEPHIIFAGIGFGRNSRTTRLGLSREPIFPATGGQQ